MKTTLVPSVEQVSLTADLHAIHDSGVVWRQHIAHDAFMAIKTFFEHEHTAGYCEVCLESLNKAETYVLLSGTTGNPDMIFWALAPGVIALTFAEPPENSRQPFQTNNGKWMGDGLVIPRKSPVGTVFYDLLVAGDPEKPVARLMHEVGSDNPREGCGVMTDPNVDGHHGRVGVLMEFNKCTWGGLYDWLEKHQAPS